MVNDEADGRVVDPQSERSVGRNDDLNLLLAPEIVYAEFLRLVEDDNQRGREKG